MQQKWARYIISMLWEIWGCRGGDYEDSCPLQYVVWYKRDRFAGTYCLQLQDRRIRINPFRLHSSQWFSPASCDDSMQPFRAIRCHLFHTTPLVCGSKESTLGIMTRQWAEQMRNHHWTLCRSTDWLLLHSVLTDSGTHPLSSSIGNGSCYLVHSCNIAVCSAVMWQCRQTSTCPGMTLLTLSLLMSYIYGAPSKALNLMYIYIWTTFFTGDFASWTVHFVNICVKTQQIHQLFIQFINYVW
jgi:hypothetical protein